MIDFFKIWKIMMFQKLIKHLDFDLIHQKNGSIGKATII